MTPARRPYSSVSFLPSMLALFVLVFAPPERLAARNDPNANPTIEVLLCAFWNGQAHFEPVSDFRFAGSAAA